MHRLHRLALTIFAFLVVGLLGISPVYAGDFDAEVQSTYSLHSDGTMDTVHNFNVVNNVPSATPTTLTIPVVGTQVNDINAKYQDGTVLDASLSEDESSIVISNVPDSSEAGKQWSLSLDYKSDAIGRFGETTALQIPELKIPELTVSKQLAVITTDIDLGPATLLSHEADTESVGLGQQVFTINNDEGPIDSSITVLFGQESVMNVEISTTLKNDGWWFTHKSFTLPPDTNQQDSFVQSISPKPDKVHLDRDGNIVVEYLLFPKSSIDVSAKAVVKTQSTEYELSSSKMPKDTEGAVAEFYLDQTEFWKGGEVNVEVTEDMTSAEIVEAVNNAVAATVEDGDLSTFDPVNRGGSLGYADTVVGELRSRGIPARLVIGKTISDGEQILGSPQNHAWAEAYVAGVGWVTVDPVFKARANYFDRSDVFHLAIGLWGAEDNRPPVDLSGYSYKYVTEPFPESEESHTVTATKHVILPGVSVFSTSVNVPSGRILDNLGANASSGKSFYFGSLAPLQTAKGRSISFGSDAFSKETVSYGIIDENGEVLGELATTETKTSYLPLIGLVGLIVFSVLFVFWRRRRKRKAEDKPSAEDRVFNHEDKGEDIENDDLIGDLNITQKNSPADMESSIPPAPEAKPKANSGTINKQAPDKPKRKPPRLVQ